MRRVLVVGATGRTGRLVLERAKAAGWAPVALARRPEALAGQEGVAVAVGDVLSPATLPPALAGCEAVICALGPGRGSPPTLCSEGTANLVQAMEAAGVRRLVCVTGALIGHPQEALGLLYRTLRKRLGPAGLADRQLQERLVMASGLDWTLVRPPRLADAAPTGACRVGPAIHLGALAHLPRADLADFLVRQLDDRALLRQAVCVSA